MEKRRVLVQQAEKPERGASREKMSARIRDVIVPDLEKPAKTQERDEHHSPKMTEMASVLLDFAQQEGILMEEAVTLFMQELTAFATQDDVELSQEQQRQLSGLLSSYVLPDPMNTSLMHYMPFEEAVVESARITRRPKLQEHLGARLPSTLWSKISHSSVEDAQQFVSETLQHTEALSPAEQIDSLDFLFTVFMDTFAWHSDKPNKRILPCWDAMQQQLEENSPSPIVTMVFSVMHERITRRVAGEHLAYRESGGRIDRDQSRVRLKDPDVERQNRDLRSRLRLSEEYDSNTAIAAVSSDAYGIYDHSGNLIALARQPETLPDAAEIDVAAFQQLEDMLSGTRIKHGDTHLMRYAKDVLSGNSRFESIHGPEWEEVRRVFDRIDQFDHDLQEARDRAKERIEELIATGMTPGEARSQTSKEFKQKNNELRIQEGRLLTNSLRDMAEDHRDQLLAEGMPYHNAMEEVKKKVPAWEEQLRSQGQYPKPDYMDILRTIVQKEREYLDEQLLPIEAQTLKDYMTDDPRWKPSGNSRDEVLLFQHIHKPDIRRKIEDTMHINIDDMPFHAQMYLLRFLSDAKSETVDRMSQFFEHTQDVEQSDVLTSFVATMESADVGTELLDFFEQATPHAVNVVCGRYAEIVGRLTEFEQEIQNLVGDRSSDVDARSIVQEYVRRANRVLRSGIDLSATFDPEVIEERFAQISDDMMLFASVTKESFQGDYDIELRDLHGVDIQTINGPEIDARLQDQMVAVASRNYATEPHVAQELRMHLQDGSYAGDDFFVVQRGEDLIAFLRLVPRSEDRVYIGSFNVNPDARGASIGLPLAMEVVRSQLEQGQTVEAVMVPEMLAGTAYVERAGFRAKRFNLDRDATETFHGWFEIEASPDAPASQLADVPVEDLLSRYVNDFSQGDPNEQSGDVVLAMVDPQTEMESLRSIASTMLNERGYEMTRYVQLQDGKRLMAFEQFTEAANPTQTER
jgi:uncharacterized protein YoaH (UPF0181 family)